MGNFPQKLEEVFVENKLIVFTLRQFFGRKLDTFLE